MRGGPGAVRAGVRRLAVGEVFRFALYNLALVTWLLAQNSALRMAMSLLVFGVLLAFLPLLGSGVKSQLAVKEVGRCLATLFRGPRPSCFTRLHA